jgi:hypothetical protein
MTRLGIPTAARTPRSQYSAILAVLTASLFLVSGVPHSTGMASTGPIDPGAPGASQLHAAGQPPGSSGSTAPSPPVYLSAGWRMLPANRTASPVDRDMAALAYDPMEGGDVLFGGYSPLSTAPFGGVALGDTWVLLNDTWHNFSALVGPGPEPRWGARMVWDAHFDRLVLFGGRNFTQFFNDTWVLNGSTWHQVLTPLAPSPRNLFQFTYDAVDGVDLLYGGWTANTTTGVGQVLGQTWAFYSQRGFWTNLTTAGTSPGPRADGSLVNLPISGDSLLYGGITQAPANGTCSPTAGQYDYYNLNAWWAATNTTALPAVFGLASATLNFSIESFYFGGATAALGCPGTNETWANTTTGWVNLTGVSAVNPLARAEAAMTYDVGAQQVVLFGGVAAGSNYLGDTWVWGPIGPNASGHSGGSGQGGGGANNTTLQPGWNLLSGLSPSPALRDMASMAYDPALGKVVLFGGYDPSILPLGDTWTFLHDQWTKISGNLTISPAPRWGARMIWDPANQALVLFGGRNLTQFFSDTWTFNASGWHPVTTTLAPAPRGFFEFTYDSADGYAILYGGGHGNLPAGTGSAWQIQTDTWSFANGSWKNITTAVTGSPTPTIDAAMTFDPNAGEALRVGGSLTGHPNGACTPVANESTYRSGTWAAAPSSTAAPPALAGESMVWDNDTGSIFLFGGTLPGGGACPGLNATWSWAAGNWTNLTSYGNQSPSGRSEEALTYDAADRQVVLFGGVSTTQYYVGDTWVWVGPNSTGNSSSGTGGGGRPLSAGEAESTSQGIFPLIVQFTVKPSYGSPPYLFAWNFGDGVSANGPAVVTHVYVAPGTFDASVLITDAAGHSLPKTFPAILVLSGVPSNGLPPAGASVPVPLTYVSLLALGALVGAAASAGVLVVLARKRRLQTEGEELVQPASPIEPR